MSPVVPAPITNARSAARIGPIRSRRAGYTTLVRRSPIHGDRRRIGSRRRRTRTNPAKPRLGDLHPCQFQIRSATPTLVAVTALNDGVDDDEDALLEVPCSLPAGNDGARDFVASHNRWPRVRLIAIDDV